MPEPKIARRCPTCGASIRDQAFFCPQCGNRIDRQKPPQPDSGRFHDPKEIIVEGDKTLTELDFRFHKDVKDQASKTENPQGRPVEGDKTLTESDFPSRNDVKDQASKMERPPGRPAALGEVGSRIQRVTTKARDVEGDVKQRVQKFREISSVVIDEAGYDPSLRFVLVAAVLFVLFIVIMLLNKLIG